MANDEYFMRRCLELGRIALSRGDAPVGSLVAIGGKIIAEGIESVKFKKDPTAHAEIEALRLACEKLRSLDLSGAALYTNLEPCEMCAFAIRQTGIGSVVFGLSNAEVGGASSRFTVLTEPDFPLKYAPPEILAGVMIAECENLQEEFRELRKIKNNAD